MVSIHSELLSPPSLQFFYRSASWYVFTLVESTNSSTLDNFCRVWRYFTFIPIPPLSSSSSFLSGYHCTRSKPNNWPVLRLHLHCYSPGRTHWDTPLYSGGGHTLTPLLLVETSLWAVHHPTPSPSTHCDSPMMDSTPARLLFGILQPHHQLHSLWQVIDSYIKVEHSILVKCTI